MKKPRGRPFQTGNKLGRGRPKGSRNKEKSPAKKLLETHASSIVLKCITQAMKGESTAMRLCMERIEPARRDAPVEVNLPSIKNAGDINRAANIVIRAIEQGKVTPSEAEKLMASLQNHLRIYETSEMEGRIEALEAVASATSDEKEQ